MRSRDFIYWMQGFMEIGDPITVSTQEVETIRTHLGIVLEIEKEEDHLPFVLWMKDTLAMAEFFVGADGFNKYQTKGLKKRLYEEFEHVVNPTLGDKDTVDKLKEMHTIEEKFGEAEFSTESPIEGIKMKDLNLDPEAYKKTTRYC